MSIGGNSNLGTLLIRRLDTALSVQASQQSQLVNATRADAIAQLADAARIDPVQNQTDRPLPETIDRAQAQVEQQARRTTEGGRLQDVPAHLRTSRPAVDTSTTPSAPTSLGNAARAILALLSLFPDTPPALQGRQPLLAARPSAANAPGAGGTAAPPSGMGAGTSGAPAAATAAAGSPAAGSPAAGSPAAGSPAAASAAAGSPAAASAAAATAGGASAPGSAPVSGYSAVAGAAAAATPHQGLPAQLVRALAQALQQSGAFYESHLHDLTQGKRTPEQVRQEPQARVTPAGQSANAATSSPLAQAGNSPASDIRQPAAPPAPTATLNHAAGVHPDTQPIVRQQLEILAAQTMSWRGEVWPDTPLEWEIARRNQDALPDENGTHWSTRLRLTFPELGEIEARISLHDKQVVMRVVAPDSASTLAQHDQALRAGFSEAGLTLSQLSILKEAQP